MSLIPIWGRMFRPIVFAFRSSTMMKGADWIIQPPDSTAMISRLFWNDIFSIITGEISGGVFGDMNLNIVERSVVVVFLPLFH